MDQIIALLERADAASSPNEKEIKYFTKRNSLGSQPLEPFLSFLCPITMDVMVDPVETSSGHTFERSAMEQWFAVGNSLCPLTMIPLDASVLRPNKTLRQSIEEWKDRNTMITIASMKPKLLSGDDEVLHCLRQLKDLCEQREIHREWVVLENYIPILIELLGAKSRDIKSHALLVLYILAKDRDDAKDRISKVDNAFESIVHSLGRRIEERKLAVALLLELSKSESVRDSIGKVQGCILLLVTMSSSDDDIQAARDAEKLLENLSFSIENVIQMAKANCFKYLLQHLSSGSEDVKLIMATTLAEMELIDLNKSSLLEDGVLSSLLHLISYGDNVIKEVAVKALQNLSSLPKNGLQMMREGVVGRLLDLLCRHTSPPTLCELIAATIALLAMSTMSQDLSGTWVSSLESDGDISRLFSLISSRRPTVQQSILQAIHAMCQSPAATTIQTKLNEAYKMIGSFLTRGLVMVLGYAYPAYECYKTVEMNKPDIAQLRFWCQYWVLFAILMVSERVGDTFVSWIPMYSEAKLAFFIYLWYPKTKGVTYVYDSFFRPYIAKHEPKIDRNLLELRTRAVDIAVFYWQRAASFGHVFEILQHVSAQSTPIPRPAQTRIQARYPYRLPKYNNTEQPSDFVNSLSERRLTLEDCVRQEKLPDLSGTLQINTVEETVTQSPRSFGGLIAEILQLAHRLVSEDQKGSTASDSEKKNTREASNSEGISTSLFGLEDLQRLFGSNCEDAANSLGVSVSTFKRICRDHGFKRSPNRIRNNVWKPPDPQEEKNSSPTCKTLLANRQTATGYEMVSHLQEPNEFPPDFLAGSNCWNTGNESGEARGSYEWAFRLRDQSTVSTSYLNPNALMFPQHQKASTQMASENMGISEDWRQHQIASTQMVSENMGISENWRQHHIASTQMVSENMGISEDWRNLFASPVDAFMEGLVSGSSNWTLPTSSNPALSQTTTTIPHMMPYLLASHDLRSVTLEATYGDTMIRFQLPLSSGIAELKEEVSLRLKLELGSFEVEYKDDDGDWILIGCDKDLRDYLQLFSSFGNQVTRLLGISEDWRPHQIESTQMVSENMGILENWRQHQIASTQMVSENMEISQAWRNFLASPTEAFQEGNVSGSSNWTVPTCFDPAPSQPTRSIPHTMPIIPYLLPISSCIMPTITHMMSHLTAGDDVSYVTLKPRYGRLADAAKSLGDIYNPGFQTPDSLERKSLDALETLSRQEQPSDIIYSEGRLTLKGCARQGILPDPLLGTLQIYAVKERLTQLPRSLGGLTPQLASSSHWPIGSPHGQQIVQLDSLEQSRDNVVHGARADQKCRTISLAEKKIFRKTLKRKWRTTSVICLEDLQQHYRSRCEYAEKSNCVSISAVKRICTPLGIHRVSTMKRIRRQHGIHRWPSRLSASTSYWPISLPYGGQIMQLDSVEWSRNGVGHGARVDQSCPTASLSEKKMVRRTLKRRCRTTNVISLDELQQHFGSRCEDAVKCLFVSVSMVKYICRQHGIHKASTVKHICRQHWFPRWPFRQKCATMKGCYLGEERSVEVISLSTDGKRDSRRQFIHISQLSRSSHWPIALPDGEIVGPIALSSSDFASTNNKARLVREDQRGSTASHSEKKNTREASNNEGISTSLFSLEDLQRLFGSKREDAANILGVSVSTFKRICRHHGIKRWPNRIRNTVWKPPDPLGEKNASPTCKTLSANGQTATWYEMVGHLQEPNEFPPDFIGGPNCWNTGNGSLEDVLRATTFHDSCPDNYPDMGSSIPPMFKESGEAMDSYEWAFQLRDQSIVSTSYLNPNALVFPQHQKASTQMVSDNMRISEDWRQPQIASTQMVSENMGISEDWRQHQIASKQMVSENMEILEDCRKIFASPAEAFMEGLVSGSSNWTLPTCSNPALSQTTTTIPHLMPCLPASQDLRSVTLKATYGDTMIRFQLPLSSGIAELKEEVSLRLKLELGSFDVEYKDEDGDWILIGCDKDLRDYLQLFSSFGNQVIRLLVVDKVPNATNFSGSCGLKRKRP